MATIDIIPDCRNSPRKLFLKELVSSLVEGDISLFSNNLQTEFNWNVVGERLVESKDQALTKIENHKLWKAQKVKVDTIITHGPEASVSGEIITNDKRKHSFCDIYKFKGAGGTRINSLTTFLIEMK